MDYTQIEKALVQLRDYEKTARSLYLANPEAYSHVVWGWEDFSERYAQTAGDARMLDACAPLPMMSMLTEQDCFPNENSEVSLILHDRYVPPFYHSLKFIKIVYALQGRFRFYMRVGETDVMEQLEEGDFVIVPPEVNQAVFCWEEGAVPVNIILKRSTFGEAFYSLLAENGSISDFFWQMLTSKGSNRALLVRCGRDERLRRLVLDMCEESLLKRSGKPAGAGANLILKGYVLLLFGRVLDEYQQKMESMGSIREAESALPEMMRYIRGNYSTVTLSSMARHFGRSEGYLSRYIRRETGRTFRFLLKDFRMKRAAEMIENSSCSIEEVAAGVGYADISCFYRNFKDSFGMTPMQYRNIRSRISW